MIHALTVLLALSSVVNARYAYQLSSGIEEILSKSITQTFSCDNRPYGYYADTSNNCELFHVCLPIPDDTGAILETAQFTFACGNQTVFSQDSLTCNYPEEALPCNEAESFYDVANSEFGRILESKRK